MTGINIKPATIADAALIFRFATELARYVKCEHEVFATLADIEVSLFGVDSSAHAVICYVGNAAIGFAVYSFNYSTWLGKNGLYVEDLYVSCEHRNIGAGKSMLKYLAQLAVTQQCGRVEWTVMQWNEPAINFYQSIGAQAQDERVGYRLAGESLQHFVSN